MVAESPEATAWMAEAMEMYVDREIFGSVESSVVWTSAVDADGNLIVPLDPEDLAASINAAPFPLLEGHDPGRPAGKVLSARAFRLANGEQFVAALLGFYDGAALPGFKAFEVDPLAPAPSPARLPDLPDDFWIVLAADPREVAADTLEEIALAAPVRVDVSPLSHNAAEPTTQLVTFGVLFVTLVWNPFVTTFANEASKDAYGAIRGWLKDAIDRLAENANPIIELKSRHQGCVVSFLFRGRDLGRHKLAHDGLSAAAARAEHLIEKLAGSGLKPVRLVYEFHRKTHFWYPSFAELADGRLITDDVTLIAAERLSSGLSLGLSPRTIKRS